MSSKCPHGRRMIDPCPRKVYTGLANACQACIDAHCTDGPVIVTATGGNAELEKGVCREIERWVDKHLEREEWFGCPIVVDPILLDDVVELRGPDGLLLARATGIGAGVPC